MERTTGADSISPNIFPIMHALCTPERFTTLGILAEGQPDDPIEFGKIRKELARRMSKTIVGSSMNNYLYCLVDQGMVKRSWRSYAITEFGQLAYSTTSEMLESIAPHWAEARFAELLLHVSPEQVPVFIQRLQGLSNDNLAR